MDSMGLIDSPDFLKKLKQGDHEALTLFVEGSSSRIYHLALGILHNEQDAEDVLQETFMKVVKSITGFEGKSALSSWVYRIAVNEALMILRKKGHVLEEVEIDKEINDEETEPLQIVDWCCLPESELMTKETKKYLEEAANDLSPSLRVVFVLRDIQGFSARETAEILGIREDAVKTRLVRARLKLRQQLSTYFGERLKKGAFNA
jgi:RNA polymerase sigma-70 factor, ECF subfamily